ncbi:MAG TPA: hypothetical protein VI776_07590 [Anaerolineales bacterium]|nr:hypothetical protein [Anaerolineales bacterium]
MKKSAVITGILMAIFLLNGALGARAQELDPPPVDPGGPPQRPILPTEPVRPPDDYWETIQRTAGMVWEPAAQRLVEQYGLNLINLTWEDTGRYYNSAVGPNISDMTIQVEHLNPYSGQYELTLMPVIRYPNFSDTTADISPDDFYLLVGNERGHDLRRITLREYLEDFRAYLSEPGSWTGRVDSLLAPGRDSHVLVSAQAAFLPIPQDGQAEFNPVLFNYQSYAGDPAVLAIVATREGTSATIIDNLRDAFPAGMTWGQRLFYNQDGERASFTGQRLSDFSGVETTRGGEGGGLQAAGQGGLNMVLLIQVPLKQKNPMQRGMMVMEGMAAAPTMGMQAKSDVEAAVIGHGAVEGPFTEVDGLSIERDPRFPIRVTVQFYKATSNGQVSESDLAEIAGQIQRVYDQADYVGSLVVDGPSDRPTEYDGPKDEPPGWWESFWQRFEQNSGLSRDEGMAMLRRLRAHAGRWLPFPPVDE